MKSSQVNKTWVQADQALADKKKEELADAEPALPDQVTIDDAFSMMLKGMVPVQNSDETASPPLSVIRHLISKLETVMYEAAATGNKADSGYNAIRLNPRASRKQLRLTADEGTRGINLNLCGRLTLLPLVGSVQVPSVVPEVLTVFQRRFTWSVQ